MSLTRAGSAQEALTEIAHKQPDAVISDIAIPNLDGIWLICQIRELSGCDSTRLPALALSALAHEFDRQASWVAGFQDQMAKPVEQDYLLRKLRALLVAS